MKARSSLHGLEAAQGRGPRLPAPQVFHVLNRHAFHIGDLKALCLRDVSITAATFLVVWRQRTHMDGDM